MSVQHDEQWLDSINRGEYETDQGIVISGLKAAIIHKCRKYHEHMTRWRSLDELPEQGQRIEIAYRCDVGVVGKWSRVSEFDRYFISAPSDESDNIIVKGYAYAWRSVGRLPE